MAMPEAKGLFHKAITMSGQQVTASGPLHARQRAQAYLDRLGAGVDPATAPVEQLIDALSATDPVRRARRACHAAHRDSRRTLDRPAGH